MSSTTDLSEPVPSQRRRYTKAADRQRLLLALHQSGLTPHEFAHRHGVTASTLQRWQGLARLKSPIPPALAPPFFIEAESVPVCLGSGLRIELLAHQAVLSVTHRAAVLWAAELLQTLSPRC